MASETPELRFERWRTRGDAAALSDVFDALAPGLVRLAIHLVGDAAAAEDLVQQTFVTAMERAASWDARRPLEPWLQGILANHARDVRKSARRAHDPDFDLEAVLAREEDAPLESASRRELSGELARAVDALEEPYRAAVLLRLRHGMEAADIAHVLGRSPGAVRVQLHRAREMLRRSLPAGIASALVILAESARGLERVRNQVLEHAARLAPAASVTGGLLGGVIVMKKVVVAAVVVLALALVAWWAQRDGIPSDRATASTTPSELAAPLARPDAERGVAMSPVESAVRTAGLEVGSEPKTATQPFRCRVVDGVTDEPIAGARVRFYAPKSSLYSEVRARWPARFVASSYGETRVHDWPWFRAPPTVEQRCDLDPVLSYEGPRNGDSPAAEATTGADGEVEVALGADQAFVVVEHPDYASRGLPPILERTYNVVGSDGNASKPVFRDDALVVGLYRAQTVRGQLIDLDGKSLAARIELRFDGYESRDRAENGMTLSSAVDSWTVPTNDDGSFTARIAAESFQVRSLDPTRVLARTAMHPERKEQWSFARAYALPTTETIWVPIRAGSSVVVRTAQGDEPVRDYFMQLRDLSTGTGMGIEARVRSDDGRTALFDGDALDSLADGRRYPLAVHVRADGFLSAKAELSDPSMSGEVVIRLERGAGPRLTGRVVDGTRAIAGATILVRAGSPRSWDCEATWASTATRTDADGRFAVDASPGGWVVQAVDGERSTCLYVEHPSSDTLVLDFSTDTAVEFVVDAPPGARFEEMLAFLRGTNNFGKRLDERGRMRFGSLPAGSYMAQLVARGMKVELQPGDDQFELAAGTTRTLNVRVTSIEQTRRARLVVEGTNAPDGWRFQSYDLTKWSAVDADGRFPIDIGVTRATVEDVEGARYSFWFEADAEEPVLRVAQQSGMCTGRIVRKDGTGASGLRVVAAIPRDAGTLVSVTALTGEGGRFELHGLPDSARSLQILDRYEREQIDGFASLTFRCGGPLRGRDVSIELPDDREWSGKAADRVALSGIARRAGAPLVGTTLRVSAFWPQRDGNLTIASDTRTLSDGRYAVTTVRAIQHAASFRVGTDHVREEFTIPEGVGEHVQDFDLP